MILTYEHLVGLVHVHVLRLLKKTASSFWLLTCDSELRNSLSSTNFFSNPSIRWSLDRLLLDWNTGNKSLHQLLERLPPYPWEESFENDNGTSQLRHKSMREADILRNACLGLCLTCIKENKIMLSSECSVHIGQVDRSRSATTIPSVAMDGLQPTV